MTTFIFARQLCTSLIEIHAYRVSINPVLPGRYISILTLSILPQYRKSLELSPLYRVIPRHRLDYREPTRLLPAPHAGQTCDYNFRNPSYAGLNILPLNNYISWIYLRDDGAVYRNSRSVRTSVIGLGHRVLRVQEQYDGYSFYQDHVSLEVLKTFLNNMYDVQSPLHSLFLVHGSLILQNVDDANTSTKQSHSSIHFNHIYHISQPP